MNAKNGMMRKGHIATHSEIALADEVLCPWCRQPLGGGHEEFLAIQTRMETEQTERFAQREQQMRAGFDRDKAKLQALAEVAIEKANRDAAKAADTRMKAIRDHQAGVVAVAVEAERARSEKAVADAIATVALEHATERTRLELALADALRKLQAKAPHQLGEPMESALFDAVSEALSGDRCVVRRVPRGRNGPDLVVEFFEGDTTGTPIGGVAVEAKNVSNWSSRFIPKLKSDARALNAEPILVTNVFPRGFNVARGVGVIDGVVVCAFPFVVPLIELLRKQIIEMHRQKLTGTERSAKGTALLDYVGSVDFSDLANSFVSAHDRLLDIEQKEQSAHATVWRRRGDLIRSLQRAHQELVAAFDAILAGNPISDAAEELA
jgi:hypothetical protein